VSTRGVVITAWLVVGHALLGALYWLLLQIPESNVLMLAASLLATLAILAWLGIVASTAASGWLPGATAASALRSGLRQAWWVFPALVAYLVVWLATDYAGAWHLAHRGEIDAWFIAHFGWTNTAPFHVTATWLLWFVRYGIGLSLAASILAGGVAGRPFVGSLRRALTWSTLLITTAAVWLGLWLPWRVVDWRPASLPSTWVQPTFAATKLAVLFIVMNIALAVVLWWAMRGCRPDLQVGRATAGPQPVVVQPAADVAPAVETEREAARPSEQV
jgi:hypothetical protein